MSIRTINQDWSRLEAGHRVVLIENGLESIATVDAITEDSSVIWVFSGQMAKGGPSTAARASCWYPCRYGLNGS